MCGSSATVGQTLTTFSYRLEIGSWIKGSPSRTVQLLSTDVKGDGVPIMWQSSDAEVLGRAYAQTQKDGVATATSPPPTSSATQSSSPATSLSAPQSNSGDLSMGAKIGIGVGIPVAVLLGLILGFLLWRRRRARQDTGAVYQDDQHQSQYPTAELEHRDRAEAPVYYGHEQTPVYEIQSTPAAHHNRHELPGADQR